MARHKPNLPPTSEPEKNDLAGWSCVIAESGAQFKERHGEPLTLAQRLEHAKAKLAAAETLLETTYWQGAVDAIEAFSAGWPMPETIGVGAKANADSEPK